MSHKQLVNASKAMSYVLRHGADKEGIVMRPDGFIYLADLLNVNSLKRMRVNEAAVEHIVNTNDKKRFELAKAGRSRGQSFDWELIAQQIFSVYEMSIVGSEKVKLASDTRSWNRFLSKDDK